ncbi:MAG: putative metallo-hydrolase [Lentisphaerae bacterium ADurb.Bin082]|nr:MAG: putative metallo-hydrolase [Lentisphaerae bacterium ADurb.Bin082]HQL86145.1 MBL fold metallo-hydrolase [Lentisphaeria bacterium]
MTKFYSLTVGLLSVNCYLAWSEDSGDAYIIDPGSEAAGVASAIAVRKLIPRGILLTHGHVDHIGAVPELAQQFKIPVWIHPADRGLYGSPDNAINPWIPAVKGLPPSVDTLPAAAGIDMKVIHTPGHTPGGVCYYFPTSGVLLSGDTLFRGTIGRTDFPGGNYDTLISSIKNNLLTLPDETKVCAGHEQSTTIARERSNPLFR